MNKAAEPNATIDEVARDTGIGKDTLRVWERRYGFPIPHRNARGERRYPPEQVSRLRTLSRLLNRGWRPGAVVPLSAEELNALVEQGASGREAARPSAVNGLIENAQRGDSRRLQQSLQDIMQQQGPLQFILDTAAPLLEQTGNAWANGQLSIYMEHLITDHLGRALHQASARAAKPSPGPRVVLTTLPGERHGMGLMMAELLLRSEGAETISLGVETPVDQLLDACRDLQPQVVALSFSALQKRTSVMAALRELSEKLPSELVLLAGGEGVSHLRKLPPRVRVVHQMEQLGTELEAIRQALEQPS
ncbi:MerR family transcriptional regulator [Motiliproteus sp. SC1-56]|uniref:MerR family transcriptional regulator n=1 Tax=Motiliproteus sp. SC1-56 TaxID=2799565 RepID=UPI001A8E216B|nr:MerR family transcriptional regulator [Motiliproteus sp. SC1-56]